MQSAEASVQSEMILINFHLIYSRRDDHLQVNNRYAKSGRSSSQRGLSVEEVKRREEEKRRLEEERVKMDEKKKNMENDTMQMMKDMEDLLRQKKEEEEKRRLEEEKRKKEEKERMEQKKIEGRELLHCDFLEVLISFEILLLVM